MSARTEHLVRMANQIAANVPDPACAAEQTAAHLRAFWAPVMIDDLAAIAAENPDDLVPAVRAALSTLRVRPDPGA
jgi:NADH-dependant formate dehydrogenase delta subunit FdsD